MTEHIIQSTDSIPPKEIIGTKAYNLMRMKHAGFPVPPFFTVLGNRPRGKPLEQEVIGEAQRFGELVMIRSCHPLESGKHPFSGEFLSECSLSEPTSIQETYAQVVASAERKEVSEYVRERGIKGFDPHAMNVIFMRYFPHRFFAMYMTAAQNNPDEMIALRAYYR